MELENPSLIIKYAISHNNVEMWVMIKLGTKMLNKTNSTYLRVWDYRGAYNKSFSNFINDYFQNILKNCIGLKIVTNTHWETYHPLPHGNKRNDLITEVSRRFSHISRITRRTNTPSLT